MSELFNRATEFAFLRLDPSMDQRAIKRNDFAGLRHSSFQRKEEAMATQKFHREQTPRQIGQSKLRWGAAKFLTSPQVARTLQVSETRVLEWLKNGDLGGLMTGRRWYITPRQLEVFLEARANVPRF